MLKFITLITKLILAALSALLLSSCNHAINLTSIAASGNVTTERRNIQGNFKSIEVNNAIDIIIEQSDKIEIVVEADDNIQKHIITKIENGTLIVSCEQNFFSNIKSKKVRVKMPFIEELEATTGSTITSKNILKGQNIRLNTSSAATIDISIESDNITCDSSSGSTITINGLAIQIKMTASSGSTINAVALLANEVSADVSSGAFITAHPIISLNAQASSAGNIEYDIEPKSIQKNISSGGSISYQ